MTLVAERPPALDLPPAFTLVELPGPGGAFAEACVGADRLGADRLEAGALVRAERPGLLDFALVLEPDEPLRSARRVFVVAMAALADATGSVAPPQKPVTIDWPDTLRFEGARLGGGRLGSPPSCEDGEVPGWLVFGATLAVSRSDDADPGFTPDSTAMDEEGFEPDAPDRVVEAFARYLLVGLDLWRAEGFPAAAARLLPYFGPRLQGERRAITEDGGFLVIFPDGREAVEPLGDALDRPAWLDGRTEGVRP